MLFSQVFKLISLHFITTGLNLQSIDFINATDIYEELDYKSSNLLQFISLFLLSILKLGVYCPFILLSRVNCRPINLFRGTNYLVSLLNCFYFYFTYQNHLFFLQFLKEFVKEIIEKCCQFSIICLRLAKRIKTLSSIKELVCGME